MKKLIVLAVAALVAAPAFAENMKWNGSAGWRYTRANDDDGLGNTVAGAGNNSLQETRAHHFRANIGVTGGWKDVEYGVGLRTGAGLANSDWVTAASSLDYAIGVEQSWFRYGIGSGFGDWAFTFGRQMNPFAYDHFTQGFFDNDVRFDGIAAGWKWGSFGITASNYFLGGRSPTSNVASANGGSSITYTEATEKNGQTAYFPNMQGLQAYMNWKFKDTIETMLAVGVYNWNKIENLGFTNANHGVNASAGYTAGLTAGGQVTPDAGNVTFTGVHQTQIYNTWTLPYNLAFSWEYVKNKRTPKFGVQELQVDGIEYSLALMYGSIKKAHDFKVGYAYGSKDLGSVINAFTNNRWVADNKGHMLSGTYALADNFELGLKAYLLKESSQVQAATGQQLTGAQTTQRNKSDLLELTAGVSF
jgi:hypothetical protein